MALKIQCAELSPSQVCRGNWQCK